MKKSNGTVTENESYKKKLKIITPYIQAAERKRKAECLTINHQHNTNAIFTVTTTTYEFAIDLVELAMADTVTMVVVDLCVGSAVEVLEPLYYNLEL
ncbi:hypothetical protein AKJ16_DCAP16482 [Drosera capensis]